MPIYDYVRQVFTVSSYDIVGLNDEIEIADAERIPF